MRGEKVVTFNFGFKYSQGGEFLEASEITLKAPGLGKRHVHYTVDAYIIEAMANMDAKRDRERARTIAEHQRNGLNVPDEDETEEENAVSSLRDNPEVLLAIVNAGLGHEKYPQFADYVLNQLTNSKLATVGEGQKMTDATWEEISQQGGMAAIDRIIGSFCTFFMEDDAPQKPTGKSKSRSSSKRQVAA